MQFKQGDRVAIADTAILFRKVAGLRGTVREIQDKENLAGSHFVEVHLDSERHLGIIPFYPEELVRVYE